MLYDFSNVTYGLILYPLVLLLYPLWINWIKNKPEPDPEPEDDGFWRVGLKSQLHVFSAQWKIIRPKDCNSTQSLIQAHAYRPKLERSYTI